MIYLDYNATTPVAMEVADVIIPYIREHYGNPSSAHEYGAKAKRAVESAREQTAALLGALPSEIVFTSGGSESNNAAIKGAAFAYRDRGRHIVASRVEHPAVLNPLRYLEKTGYEVSYVPVDAYGAVSPSDVKRAITSDTVLVTIMHANNETGTIQPIREIAAVCREKGVLFHTDAAQTVGKIPVDVNDLGVDLLTVAGHKLYAPKGIGALFIKDGVSPEPLIHGAGHESGRRAGTENVAFDAGLGMACALALDFLPDGGIRRLTDRFFRELKTLFGDGIRLNGHPENRLPNTLFISFLKFGRETVLNALSGIAVSMGSACHSGSTTLSPVLAAMGVDEAAAGTPIRFSLGRATTDTEIDRVLEKLSPLRRLR